MKKVIILAALLVAAGFTAKAEPVTPDPTFPSMSQAVPQGTWTGLMISKKSGQVLGQVQLTIEGNLQAKLAVHGKQDVILPLGLRSFDASTRTLVNTTTVSQVGESVIPGTNLKGQIVLISNLDGDNLAGLLESANNQGDAVALSLTRVP